MDQFKIRKITESEYFKVRNMAPIHGLRTASIVLSCLIEEEAVGIVILMKKDKNWGLTWIYVLPEYQEQGIGSRLLDRAILEAKKNGTQNLEVALGGETDQERRLMAMLGRRGFFIDFHVEPVFSVSRDQLKQALFYSQPEILGPKISSDDSIISLRYAKSRQLEYFIKNRERHHNYVASRADYASADPSLSRLLISNSQIVGAILVDRIGEGIYFLELCFIEKNYLKALIRLMKTVSDQLLTGRETLNRIEFSCGLDSMLKAAKALLPDHSITNAGITTGWKNLQSNVTRNI